MYNPSYLMLSRHNLYYFRYPLPRSTSTSREYLRISLGTRDPKEALHLAKLLEYYVSEISRRYKDIWMQDPEIKKRVGDYLKARLQKQRQLIDDSPYGNDKEEQWSNAIKTIQANPAPYVEKLIGEMGLNIDTDSDDFQMLSKYIKLNIPEYYKALKDYNEQAFIVDLQPESLKDVKPIYRLDDTITNFIENSAVERNWTDDTKAERIYFLNTLKEILGDEFNTADMDRKKAGEVADIIYKLPVNRTKNPVTKDLSIVDAIKIAGIEKMSIKTIKKYISTFSIFFEWCEGRGYSESNPFTKIQSSIAESDTEGRLAFTDEEIKSILDEINKYPNGIAKKEYEYWGTLIAAYTGARLNEVAQLELNDIKQLDGIWCFDINDEGDKKLKTKASRRKIPIHKALLDAKILEYVAELKEQGKTRLLYKLPRNNKGYGKNLGRFFNERLLPQLNIKAQNVSFHCLRHTVNTRLLQEDVELFKIQALLGHSLTIGMTKEYAKEGFKLTQLNEALHKLPY